MSTRNTDDAEVQRIVGFIGFPSQEVSLIEMTKTWSEADFLYALERVDIHQPVERREGVRELYRKLRVERQLSEARRSSEEASARRHQEISDRLDQLKTPHWSIVPNFWATIAVLLLTAVGVVAAILALKHKG